MITGKLFLTIKNSPLASQLELAPLKSNDLLILIFIDTDDLAVTLQGTAAGYERTIIVRWRNVRLLPKNRTCRSPKCSFKTAARNSPNLALFAHFRSSGAKSFLA